MTVSELREILADYSDETEVRLISQPLNRPLVYHIASYADDSDGQLCLVEGQQIGYANNAIRAQL